MSKLQLRYSLLGTVMVGGLALGSSAAQAIPYAFASNQVTNIGITGGFTVSPGTAIAQANDTAQYGAFPIGGGNAAGPIGTLVDVDEAIAGLGPFPGQNDYSPSAGLNLGMTGSRGDVIISAGTAGNVFASNVAESHGNAIGSAQGKDTAALNFSFLTGAATTNVTISFDDLIYLAASTAAAPLENGNAHISNDFKITDALTGALVFEFTPSGGSGSSDVVGGTVTSDPFNLNTEANSTSGSVVNPITNSGFFSATSDSLTANTEYNVSVVSSSQTSITPGPAVPEPGTLSLLGGGLVWLAAIARRRRRRD